MNEEVVLPSIDEVLEDSATSWWLRDGISSALARDPVDALNDALLLAGLLDQHLRRVFELDNPS
jgi:DNA polymerase III epsilon subunit-like protein